MGQFVGYRKYVIANVRELVSVIEVAVAHAHGGGAVVTIEPIHFPARLQEFDPATPEDGAELSAALVLATLKRVGGNQSEAARELGVHRNTIGRYLRQVG